MDQIIEEILKAVIFENWLRFYFIAEKISEECGESVLEIEIPAKALQDITVKFPEFLPVALCMNNKPVEFATSRQAVLTCIESKLTGKKLPAEMALQALTSPEFQNRVLLFNNWLQMHEAQLDQSFLEFEVWLQLFDKWLQARRDKQSSCDK